jgi:hypothetical protein
MRAVPRHQHPRLRRLGVATMVVGGVLVLLPAPPADPLDGPHEIVRLLGDHLWWQFAGVCALFVGNTLRLIGVQGHPGLPWPLFGRKLPHDVFAGIQVHRRAWENRARIVAGLWRPDPERARSRRRRRIRLAARRVMLLRGCPTRPRRALAGAAR